MSLIEDAKRELNALSGGSWDALFSPIPRELETVVSSSLPQLRPSRYSFVEVSTAAAELVAAQRQAGVSLIDPVYALQAPSFSGQRFRSVGSGRVRVPVNRKIEVIVSPRIQSNLLRRAGGTWGAVSAV